MAINTKHIIIIMIEPSSLLRLMSWLSPAFPTGGFAYSAGLEQAVAESWVTDNATLQDWILCQLTYGSLWNDGIFLTQAHELATKKEDTEALIELAMAMSNGRERLEEAINQGTSFIEAAEHWEHWGTKAHKIPLPIAVGLTAGYQNIDKELTASAYLHSFVSNQLQCAIRLSIIGQNSAAQLLAKLEPNIAAIAKNSTLATLDDLGTSAMMADIATLRHETLQPRLFKS